MYDCIRSEKMEEWEVFCSKDCNDSFTADAGGNFVPRACCAKQKNMIEESPDCSRKNFDVLKCCICLAGLTADMTL